MMRKPLPFYRQVRFKLIGTIITVLIISFIISHYYYRQFSNKAVERLVGNQFVNAANIAENFIDFAGQSGLMAAKFLAEDPKLQLMLSQKNTQALKQYFSTAVDRIAADTAILLDIDGNILAVSGYPDNTGNLRSLTLVRDSLTSGQPAFSIVQDMGTFILYASSSISIKAEGTKQIGLILTGYALNNTFVDNLKKNTNFDLAIVRERSIIAGTFQNRGKRLNTIPIPFTEYRMILNNPDKLISVVINGIPYYVRSTRLRVMQKNMSGSLFLAYPQQEFIDSEILLKRQHLLLLIFVLVLIVFVLLIVSRRFLGPVAQLAKAAADIDHGDLTIRVIESGNDEFALLGKQFNKMIDGLQQKDKALRDININLEKEVAARTKELDTKNTLLDSIINAASDLAIIATDEKLKIKFFNPEAEQILQINKDKVLGISVAALYENFSIKKEKVKEKIQNLHLYKNYKFSFKLPFPDKTKLIEAQIRGLWDSTNQSAGYIFLAKDITQQYEQEIERRTLEEKLQRAQKMEAIGLMAGGVAHDLNNVLSGIVSYPDLLLLKLPPSSKLIKPVKAIQESGKRAATIVADLLTIAKGVASAREPHVLNTLIAEHLNSPEYMKLKDKYPEVVYINKLAAIDSVVLCSPVHIKKTVLNLIINAIEATGDTGKVKITTTNQQVDESEAKEQAIAKGYYVVLTVQDSGKCISVKDLEHIFEPFYTKRVMGRGSSGTGIGLAVVWNTVQDHKGRILVDSSEKGTRFQLYFPVCKENVPVQTNEENTDTITGNNEHILIVDDEPQLRDIATQLLFTMGYRIDSVNSGEQAIEFIKDITVDLIVMDMLMEPGMNGHMAYKEILKLCPGQKAIIVSGFAGSDDVEAALQLGAGGFLKKPYSMNQLGRAVKDALNS